MVNVVVYPLDTLKTRCIVATNATGRRFDGLKTDLAGRALTTGTYMSVYEHALGSWPVAHSAAAASVVSSIPRTVFDICKKQRQTRRAAYLTVPRTLYAYGLTVCKHLPRSCIHYIIYEALLARLHGAHFPRALKGAIAAAVGTSIASLVIFPLEVVRLRLLFPDPSAANLGRLRSALKISLLSAVISSSLGHGLLEWFSPRRPGA